MNIDFHITPTRRWEWKVFTFKGRIQCLCGKHFWVGGSYNTVVNGVRGWKTDVTCGRGEHCKAELHLFKPFPP